MPPPPPAAAALQPLQPGDGVEAAIAAAAAAAGRGFGPAERALAARLRDNWFERAADVAAMAPADAAALGVPLRVLAFVRRALGESSGGSGDEGDGVPGSASGSGGESDGAWPAREAPVLAAGPPVLGASAMVATLAPGSGIGSGSSSSSSSRSATDQFAAAQDEGAQQAQQQQGASAAQDAALPADIMQRRAPPRRRPFKREHVNVTKRTALPPYGLRVRAEVVWCGVRVSGGDVALRRPSCVAPMF